MTIPKEVNILGTVYKVEILDNKEDTTLKENNIDGYVHYHDKRIVIQKTEDTQQENDTFNHELFHALLYEAGHEDYSHDETLINALERLIPKIKHLIR